MIYISLFTVAFMVATIIPFGSEAYFITLLSLDKYNNLVYLYKENFLELSEVFKVKSLNQFYIKLFGMLGTFAINLQEYFFLLYRQFS